MKIEMEMKEMNNVVIVKNSINGEGTQHIIQSLAKNLGILAGEILNKTVKKDAGEDAKKLVCAIYELDFITSLRDTLGFKGPEEEKKEEE